VVKTVTFSGGAKSFSSAMISPYGRYTIENVLPVMKNMIAKANNRDVKTFANATPKLTPVVNMFSPYPIR
jgi:hypothetical protein